MFGETYIRPTPSKKNVFFVTLFLVMIVTAVYYPSLQNDFVSCCDDDGYILYNDVIRSINRESVRALFSTFRMGNYHPLTDLTWAVDFAVHGENARGFHLTNLLLHLGNCLLVFFLLIGLSGGLTTSFFCALVFGIHPMHVEAVAWISARKDVLFVFFYLLTLLVYLQYLRTYRTSLLIVVTGLFACAVLSKSAAITLPVALWILDILAGRKVTRRMILEKAHLLVVAVFFGLLAIESQKAGSSLTNLSAHYSIAERIVFVCYALCFYVVKFFAPVHLSAMHLYPEAGQAIPWYYWASPSFLILLAWAASKLLIRKKSMSRSQRYILTGSLLFLVNITLVLQIVPMGRAIVSERYTYLSYVGILISMTGMTSRRTSGLVHHKAWLVAAWLWVAMLSLQSHHRCYAWQNSLTLIEDVIHKYPNNSFGYLAKGDYLQVIGEPAKALSCYNKVIALRHDHYQCYVTRGNLLSDLGHSAEAIADYERALRLQPYKTDLMQSKARELVNQGEYGLAIEAIKRSVAINPNLPDSYVLLGNAFYLSEQYKDATEAYTQAIQLEKDALFYYNRGNAWHALSETEKALQDYTTAIDLNPNMSSAYYNRGAVFFNTGQLSQSCNDWHKAAQTGHQQARQMIEIYCDQRR